MTGPTPGTLAGPDPAGTTAPQRMGAGAVIRRASNLLIESRPVLMATLLAVVVIYMGIAHGERFFNQANLSSVLLDAAQVGILTIGVTILMIGGAIDLSVGSMLGLAGIVAGLLVKEYLLPVAVAFPIGILVGMACGVINGLIVTRLHINALIATLATLGIYRSLAQLLTGTGVTTIGHGFAWVGQSSFLGVQFPFWIMFALTMLFTC